MCLLGRTLEPSQKLFVLGEFPNHLRLSFLTDETSGPPPPLRECLAIM